MVIDQGVLAGVIFLLGVLLIFFLPKYKWLAAAILLIGITPLATLGFWFSQGPLGINDWDFYFTVHTTIRNILLDYHQFPQWNPYICGGTAGIGDPEFRFFTPTFLLQLIFGVPAGLRLAIYLATATGAVGMLLLAKRLKLSVYAALLAAIAVAFSSVNLLEIVEGHPNIFAAMYIPWIFWAWLAAYRKSQTPMTNSHSNPKPQTLSPRPHWSFIGHWLLVIGHFNTWPLITGIFLALTFFEGGIYLLMYTTIAFIGLFFLVPRRKVALIVTVQAGLWALGLAAVKLIPVLFWLRQFQDEHYVTSANILPYLDKILLGRILHGSRDIISNQTSGWHEYGAYIGPVILVLAIVGLIGNYKRRLVCALCLAAAAAVLLASSGQTLEPFFDQISFIPRSNISRFILFAVIPLGLLAGFGLDTIHRRLQKIIRGRTRITYYLLLITPLLLGAAAADLMSLSYQLSEQAFIVPRHVPAVPLPDPDPINYTASTYDFIYYASNENKKTGVHEKYTRAYEATLKGFGTLNYCTPLTPMKAVRTIHDESGAPIIDIETADPGTRGTFTLRHWTPNRVTVDVHLPVDGTVMLNANYAKGWWIYTESNGHLSREPAREAGNRVAAPLPAGTHHLAFQYKTPGLKIGIAVSIITFALAAIAVYRHRKRQT